MSALVLVASHGLVWELSSPSANRPDRSAAEQQANEHAGYNPLAALLRLIGDGWSPAAMTLATIFLAYMAGEQRKTTRAQLRPYCMVRAARIEGVAVGVVPRAFIKIKNSGQTPAAEFRQWASMGVDRFPQTIAPPLSENEDELPAQPLPPGEEIEIQPFLHRPLTTAQVGAIRSGAAAIYVVGKIIYTDNVGKERFTEFCLFAGGPMHRNIVDGTMSAYQGQNRFT